MLENITEKARTRVGNTIFLLGKYPDKIFFHQPWLANDNDVIQHLNKNGIKIDELHARTLIKENITVIYLLKSTHCKRPFS